MFVVQVCWQRRSPGDAEPVGEGQVYGRGKGRGGDLGGGLLGNLPPSGPSRRQPAEACSHDPRVAVVGRQSYTAVWSNTQVRYNIVYLTGSRYVKVLFVTGLIKSAHQNTSC